MAAFSEFSPPLHHVKTTLNPIILAIGIAIAGIVDLQSPRLERHDDSIRSTNPINTASDSRQES